MATNNTPFYLRKPEEVDLRRKVAWQNRPFVKEQRPIRLPNANTIYGNIYNDAEKAKNIRYAETDLARENRKRRTAPLFGIFRGGFSENTHSPQFKQDAYYANREEDEEEKERLAKEKADAEREKAYAEQSKEYTSEYTKWLRNLPEYQQKDAQQNPLSYKLRYALSDMIGYGVDNAANAHASSLAGKIALNDQTIELGEAAKQEEIYKQQLDLLKEIRDNSTDVNQINNVNKQMYQIMQKMEDPDFKQKVNAYKAQKEHSYYPALKTVVSYLSNLTNINDPDINHARSIEQNKNDARDYDERMAKRASDYLNNANDQQYRINDTSVIDRNKKLSDYIKQNRNNIKMTPEQRKQMKQQESANRIDVIDKDNKGLIAENEEYRDDYVKTLDFQDRAARYWNVSKSYQKGAQLYQDASLLNPMYWFYVMPGTIGSSNSSPDQIRANAIQTAGTVAGLAAAPFTGGATAAAITNIGTIASIPGQIQGGFDENYAEVGDKYIDNFKKALNNTIVGRTGYEDIIGELAKKSSAYWKAQGMSKEWIAKHTDITNEEGVNNVLRDALSGLAGVYTNDPRFKKAAVSAKLGLQALFEADNMRTMGKMPVSIATQLMPVNSVLGKAKGFAYRQLDRAAGKAIAKRFGTRIETDAAGNIVARSTAKEGAEATAKATEEAAGRYSNGFRKKTISETFKEGYNAGSTTSDLLGFGYAGHVAAGTIGGVTSTGARLAKQLLPKKWQAYVDNFGEQMMHKYQHIYDKLLPQGTFRNVLAKYGVHIASNALVNSMQEGTEEGVQYLNSLQDYASKYGYDGMSWGDLIMNDIKQGGRVTEAYASLFGLNNSQLYDDTEFWNNVKGGFALGGGHSGLIQLAGNTASGIREYNTNQLLINGSVFNREAESISRANNKAIVKAITNHDGQAVLNIIDDMRAADRRREDPQFSEEYYDAKEKEVKMLMNEVNNSETRAKLKAKGIEYGTDEYNTAISDIVNLKQSYAENNQQQNDNQRKLTELYSSKEVQDDIERIAKETSGQVSITEDDNIADQMLEDDEIEAIDNRNKADAEKDVHTRTVYANRLRALLQIKAKINTANNWFNMLSDKFGLRTKRPDAKAVSNSIDKQIQEVKNKLRFYDDEFDAIANDDAKALDYVTNNSKFSKQNNDEIVEAETERALLNADAVVTKKYISQFEYGLVKTEDGKAYEYNPKEYAYQRQKHIDDLKEKQQELLKDLRGKAEENSEQKAENNKNTKENKKNEHIREKASSYISDDYRHRVFNTMWADERNAKLNWAVSDIYNGDFASNVDDDASKLDKELDRTIQKYDNEDHDIFTDKPIIKQNNTSNDRTVDTETPSQEIDKPKHNSKHISNLRKRVRARQIYRDVLRRWNNFSKGTMRVGIPFDDAIVKILGNLVYIGIDSIYKFQDFINDAKDVIRDKYDINDSISTLRKVYNKTATTIMFKHPETVGNFSTAEDIYSIQQPHTEELHEDRYIQIQKKLDSIQSKIIEGPSDRHFTFVRTDDGKVEVYPSYTGERFDLQNSEYISKYNSVMDVLKKCNDEESFKSALDYLSSKYDFFDFSVYKDYYNVDDINHIIATSFKYSNFINVFMYNANTIRNAITNFFIEEDRQKALDILKNTNLAGVEFKQLPGYADFIRTLLSYKDLYKKNGYRVLNTFKNIYGTISDGKKAAIQADLILVNEDGDIRICDIATSYRSIHKHLNEPPTERANFTTFDRYKAISEGLINVLQPILDYKILGTSVLPVVYNLSEGLLVIEKPISIKLDPTCSRGYSDTHLEETQKELNDIIDLYNSYIQQFNALLDDIKNKQYTKLDLIDPTQITDTSLGKELISTYRSNIEDIKEKIADLQYQKQEHKTEQLTPVIKDAEYEEALQQIYNSYTDDEYYNIQNILDDLQNKCSELDRAANQIPFVKVTTAEERKQFDHLYSLLYDTELAIYNILVDKNLQSKIDIVDEIQCVASIIEKLHIVDDQFNNSVIEHFFSIIGGTKGLETSKTDLNNTSNLFQYYFQTINDVWLDGIIPRLDQIDDDRIAQNWYGNLLNNYFNGLLQHATDYINSIDSTDSDTVTLLNGLQSRIEEGLDVIKWFNEKYGPFDENQFKTQTTNPVEIINRMPVSYMSGSNFVTAHSPSIQSMDNSKQYFYMSNAPGFIKNGNFEFFLENNKLKLRCSYDMGNGYGTQVAILDFEQTFTRNGQLSEYARIYNKRTASFVDKVKAMLRQKEQNPNLVIDMNISRNKGTFIYEKYTNKDGSRNQNLYHRLDQFLMNPSTVNRHNFYTMTVSEEDRIGVLVTNHNVITGTNLYEIRTGTDLNTHLSQFNNDKTLGVNSGCLIYMYDDGRLEDSPNRYQPVVLTTVQFGDKVANGLIQILKAYTSGDKVIQYKGNTFNVENLLGMYLYMYDQNRRMSEFNTTNTQVKINGDIVNIGSNHYLVSDPMLRQVLSTMTYSTDVKFLNQSLFDSETALLHDLREQFKANPDLKEIELPTGTIFNRDDFTHDNGQNEKRGSTVLGFYARNGIIATKAKGKAFTAISIDDVKLIDKTQASPKVKQATETVAKQNSEKVKKSSSIQDRINNLLNDFLGMQGDEVVRRNSQEQSDFMKSCQEYVDAVLGNTGTITFGEIDKIFLSNTAKNPNVLGICSTAGIGMSLYAPESVKFHEAFHMVFELAMNPKDRDKFYELYRKYNGNNLSDREVAEGLADMFTDYMTNKEDVRKAKWYSKIFKWFKCLGFHIGMLAKYKSAYINFLSMYHDINNGKYKDRKISKEQNDRFKNLFGNNLFYTVENYNSGEKADLSFFNNSFEVHQFADAFSYILLAQKGATSPFTNIDDIVIDGTTPGNINPKLVDLLCGNGKNEEELTLNERMFREMFESEKRTVYKDVTEWYSDGFKRKKHTVQKGFIQTYYPNFAAISQIVKDRVISILSSHNERIDIEEDEAEQNTDDKAINKNIDKYDRASYEFAKSDSFNKRTKLFFSSISYAVFTENEKDYTQDTSRNIFGVPTFMPFEEVYNILVNEYGDIQSSKDLYNRLHNDCNKDPMHLQIYTKFKALYENQLTDKVDEYGNYMPNYDIEALVTNIFRAIKSQRLNFIIAKSETHKGNKTVSIKNSSFDHDAARFPSQWFSYLISGQTGVFKTTVDKNGKLQLEDKYKNVGNTEYDIFHYSAYYIDKLKNLLQDTAVLNEISDQQMQQLKHKFINILSLLGIQVSNDAFNYMLSQKYKNTGAQGFRQLLFDNGKTGINSFVNWLNSCIDSQTLYINETFNKGYNIGFIKELGTYQGAYDRLRTQSMTNGLDMKKLFMFSQNNTISYITDLINIHDTNNSILRTILNYNYNVMTTPDGFRDGSFILNALLDNKKFKLKLSTYNGFKTDIKSDYGVTYKDEQDVEDFMAKFTMLQNGILIMPTLADKGTWVCAMIQNDEVDDNSDSAVKIPGMIYTENKDGGLDVKHCSGIQIINGTFCIKYDNSVLDQLLSYARCELAAIEKCKEDLKTLPKEKQTKNYYSNQLGTKFLSLTKIRKFVEEKYVGDDGKKHTRKVLKSINLNDPKIDPKAEFFNLPIEEQRQILSLTLTYEQTNRMLQKMVDLGIIKRVNINNGIGFSVSDSDKSSFKNFENVLLDDRQISAVYQQIYPMYAKGIEKLSGVAKSAAEQVVRSYAIAIVAADVNNRAIIAEQEAERLYIGHPGFFKVKFDENNITDLCSDKQKRIGSLVSTGDDNNIYLSGVKPFYNCAECHDYEVFSTSDVAPKLKDYFYASELRSTYAQFLVKNDKSFDAFDNLLDEYAYEKRSQAINEVYKSVYEMSVEDIEKALRDSKQSKLLDTIRERSDQFASAYLPFKDKKGNIKGDINVADGSAFITEDMCMQLLRQRGALTNEVKKAFDILKDEKSNWQDKVDATKLIYDQTTFITTKYTAYGTRTHDVTGVAVPYLNKFALFPLFNCLCTGRLRGVYDKMKNEHVDMLLMDSAVKIGSQGAIDFNGNSFDEPFNVYQQPYALLRMQLNTDPEEGDKISFGTQALKKVLSNLRLGRNYTVSYSVGNLKSTIGEQKQISGEDLLKDFMQCVHKISEFGVNHINEMFFDKDGLVDMTKLSKYLQKQMTSRNADTIVLQAIRTHVDNEGNVQMNLPLAATPDAKWIESILISTMNKYIVDITTPGSSFVQRSVFAMEDGTIQGDQSSQLYNGKRLQMINEDKSMDAVVSLDYFEDILPKNLTFNEARQWLIDNHIIGENARANTIGYRIPTQAQSSIHALRFVDVVQAVKSTIILPEEFTKITGSDFDIDHLYLARYNYHKDKDGNITNEYGDDVIEHYQNRLLDNMMTLLKDVDYSFSSLYKSIDNDTENVSKPAKKNPKGENVQGVPYVFGSLWEQVTRRNDYITGKKGIAPFALNTTGQVMTYLFNVAFTSNDFTRNTRVHYLNNLTDGNYVDIDSWLSGFINAHVDIVKDPYISAANVNPFTYNMLNLLIRSGYGESSMWFIGQPIIRKLSELNNRFASKFAKDFNDKRNREQIIFDEIISMIGNINLDVILNMNNFNDKKKANIVNAVFENPQRLEDIALNKEVNPYDEETLNRNAAELLIDTTSDKWTSLNLPEKDKLISQRRVFFAYKILEPYINSLSSLIQYTKIDTRKQGKNMAEIFNYYHKYNDLMNPVLHTRKGKDGKEYKWYESLFDVASLQNLDKNSWIRYKTDNAILTPFHILDNQSFNGNYSFLQDIYNAVESIYGKSGVNAKRISVFADAARTSIMSNFINMWMQSLGIDPHKLFYGKYPIAWQANRLKYLAQTDEQYAHLKNNLLINKLQIEMKDDPYVYKNKNIPSPQFVTISRNIDNSRTDSEALRKAWNDLLNDSNPKIRKFAQSLVAYAFLTSGDYQGWNKLFKYVPYEWRVGQNPDSTVNGTSFGSYIQDTLRNEVFNFSIDDIIANNIDNFDIVKHDTLLDANNKPKYVFANNGIDPETPYVIARPYDNDGYRATAPKFIAIRKKGKYPNKQLQYNLYKLVSQPEYTGEDNYLAKSGAVYVLVPTKGYNAKRGYSIYEYGRDDNYYENSFVPNINITKQLLGVNLSNIKDNYVQEIITQLYNQQTIVTSQGTQFTKESKYNVTINSKGNINVYYSTGENIWLSNFVERPFIHKFNDGTEIKFYSVEQAFQYIKAKIYANDDQLLKTILSTTNGNNLRQLGRSFTISTINIKQWDRMSASVLKSLMLESFQQNEDFKTSLINTGTAKITHTFNGEEQYKGIFSANLMDIRYQLQEASKIKQTPSENTHFGTIEQQIATLNSDKTILTNEEILKISPFKGDIYAPKIAVASEHTDPVFFAKKLVAWSKGETALLDRFNRPINFNDMDALYIITKHDGLPLRDILQIPKPKIIHFSVTTLGGTKYEPGIMKWRDMMSRIKSLIEQGLDPNDITLRIDPIIPGVTKLSEVDELMKMASEMGIKKVKFSILDYYSTTAKYMQQLGYDYAKYGYDTTPHRTQTGRVYYNTDASKEVIDKIADKMLELANKYGIRLSTCAESVAREGISKEGCLSVNAINKLLGTKVVDKGTENNKFRSNCTCYGGKVDLLSYNNKCPSICVYCYAHHQTDHPVQYYDKDGNLIDNALTRTTRQRNNPSEYHMYSGAAIGSDTEWKNIGKEFGLVQNTDYTVSHMDAVNKVESHRKEVEDAYQKVMDRLSSIGRKPMSGSSYSGKLVRRDYLQAKAADAIFAICDFEPNNTFVKGGTAYAVEYAKDMKKPIHVFIQSEKQWYIWDYQNVKFVPESTPVLTNKFAGIGTRHITEDGKQAIRNVYINTFGDINNKRFDADNVKFKGAITFSYGNNKRNDIKASTTFEAIKLGDNVNATQKDYHKPNVIQRYNGVWTREEAEKDANSLYIFTDNTNRTSGVRKIDNDSWYAQKYGKDLKYPTQTQAVLRGLDNAYPISTQHWYNPKKKLTREKGNWQDADINEFKNVIDSEIEDIKQAWNTGRYDRIFVGEHILNGGISNITKERTPILYKYLFDKLVELNKYVNDPNNNHQKEYKEKIQQIQNLTECSYEDAQNLYNKGLRNKINCKGK